MLFSGTVTLTLADHPYLLGDLINAVDTTKVFELAVNVVKIRADEANGSRIYQGSSRMVSPGAGLPPVDYGDYLDPDDKIQLGEGSAGNNVNLSDKKAMYFMAVAAGKKLHIDCVVW